MKEIKPFDGNRRITLLIIDDSLSFRRILREVFAGHPRISIVGEASTGIQGLELVVKTRPHVIIMDMEMPLMGGMTALQHLMIHLPTPTIMFSSLTKEGTTKSFEALKNGAADFVFKGSFFHGKVLESLRDSLINKVLNAASVSVRSREPILPNGNSLSSSPVPVRKVIFCEECGGREVVDIVDDKELGEIVCSTCGDRIHLHSVTKFIRNNFITFIGVGEGGYTNLFNIVPKLRKDMNGSLIVQIHAETDHVDAFAQYLDSISTMNVIRIRDGLSIEGGNCYLASGNENITLKPYSANYTLRCSKTCLPGLTPIDAAMISIAGIFKNHVAGIILSGNETDGEEGIRAIQKNNGSAFVLNPRFCLCKRMGENILRACSAQIIEDEAGVVKKIQGLHLEAKEAVQQLK